MTSSGMSAILAGALAVCQAGDEIVSMMDIYGGTAKLFEVVFARLGIAPETDVKDGARYVLSQFKRAQYEKVSEVLDRAAAAVDVILSDGVDAAMNRFNRKPDENDLQ